jgi:hypothetical protein
LESESIEVPLAETLRVAAMIAARDATRIEGPDAMPAEAGMLDEA